MVEDGLRVYIVIWMRRARFITAAASDGYMKNSLNLYG